MSSGEGGAIRCWLFVLVTEFDKAVIATYSSPTFEYTKPKYAFRASERVGSNMPLDR